ncbi:hypothetical protein I4U23_026885 [Adineta vaga]|nr:hypothetical protein I4U23_026885 [Adineta vaga]
MIGIFTIVITLQQYSLNKENRQKDLEIADQLRQQQRHLDEQRRIQEFKLNEARRHQDLSIADNKQRDTILTNYIRDLTKLLIQKNYVFNRALLYSILRPMTLTVLRQLDPSRKVLLIKFLYESKMLRTDYENQRLDLTDGDLIGIHLSYISMRNLSLSGALMINASFVSIDLTMADFQGADLTDSSFRNVDLSEANFYRTRLIRTQFPNSYLSLIDLSLADLTESMITNEQIQDSISFNMAKMPDGSEGKNTSFIYHQDQCQLFKWNINPEDSIQLNDKCHFIVLKNNSTMKYRIPLFLYQSLILKQEALFQLYFQGKIQNCQIYFEYFDQNGKQMIHRESGKIVRRTRGTIESFLQYEITADYPRHAYYLYLNMYLTSADIYTEWKFYIQHFDYKQYRGWMNE